MICAQLFLVATLAVSALASPVPELFLHPDVGLNTVELIAKHGYPVERHENLITEDGYILEMQRIPHGINNAGEKNKPPVLFLHGLMSSSADWVNVGPGNSLAYALADLGYDVWLGNARGNAWSRKHKTLSAEKDPKEFWDFSWDEIGRVDLPLMIDHVLAVNGADKLFYIGHSQGTTAFYVLMSEKPEYNEKIRLMSALAPVAFMNHMSCSFCHFAADHVQDVTWLANFLGIHELLPKSEVFEFLGRTMCEETAPIHEVCASIVFLLCGWDSEQLNRTLVPVILTNIPSGSATKQLLHYAQEIKSGHFRRYDLHSDEANLEKYNQTTPPDYKISNIVAPIALYYGQNDHLTSVTDVERLRELLPNVAVDMKISYKKFNHLDFLFATDAFELLYNDVIKHMQEY